MSSRALSRLHGVATFGPGRARCHQGIGVVQRAVQTAAANGLSGRPGTGRGRQDCRRRDVQGTVANFVQGAVANFFGLGYCEARCCPAHWSA